MILVQILVSFGFSLLVALGQVPPYPGAGCTFDPACFYYAAGCGLAKCPPFNRSTPVTCNQCIQMCNEKLSGEYPYFCRSVVYDCRTKTCDMFGVDETSGGWLTRDPNKFYFKPTLQCKGSTPAPATAAPVSSCPAGQAPKMIAVQDRQFVGVTGTDAPGVDQAGCAKACLNNQVPGSNAPIDCHSAQFKGGKCTLATSTATAENQLQDDPGSSYIQKFCFDAASGASCPDIFDEYPQHVLIGQNRQTVDSQSLQDCVQQCLSAKQKYGFGCNSAEFYYNIKTQNCILNDETRKSRPDLFSAITDERVTYIETQCGGGQVGTTAGPGTLGPLPTPAPVIDTTLGPVNGEVPTGPTVAPGEIQTTTWIGGDLGAGLVTLGTLSPVRFLADAKKEALKDAFRDFSTSKSVCRALVYNGEKKCPIGVMAQGERLRYCVHPVDC